jgi:hypothetical protein
MWTRSASFHNVVLSNKVRIALSLLFVAAGAIALVAMSATGRSNEQQFRELMQTVAAGWNEGNPAKAANCFTEDAVYMEPPDKQVYVGRAALFEFFGGAKGPEIPMHILLSMTRNRPVWVNTRFRCGAAIMESSW